MRVQNAKQAAADLSYPMSSTSRGGLINLGLHIHQKDHYLASRLSTSCPSLNNSLSRIGSIAAGQSAMPINENNNLDNQDGGGSFDMNSNYHTGPISITPGHPGRRRKNNDPNNPAGTTQQSGNLAIQNTKGHRKRQGHHRHRRYYLKLNSINVVTPRLELYDTKKNVCI